MDLVTGRTRLKPFAEADAAELLVPFRDPGVRRYLLDDRIVSPSSAWIPIDPRGF